MRDISVTLPDKTTTAVIGPSGSGKTTFCNLIARFWDTDSGSVKIDGYDVKDYTLESLMEQISIVFQNVYLFSDTIENNIKFGKPEATHDEVVAAAKAACCDDFIGSLPDGYQTVIGEGGSGGALAIGVGDRTLMLEYSTYSVISPEGCASILWKTAERAKDAAEALGITAPRLLELGLIDQIVKEPLGGAHRDPQAMAERLKQSLLGQLDLLERHDSAALLQQRYERLRSYGRYQAA